MFITVRNLIVHIIASFIGDKEARHEFRNKYKRKSKFRKLRDDNKRLFDENNTIRNELTSLRQHFDLLKKDFSIRLEDMERERSHIFRVAPMDDAPPQGSDIEVFLAIACIAKNEAPYLKEWIEYHKIVGVERFYFYDNESDDNTKEILEPYIKDGTVVYHFLPNHPITKRLHHMGAVNDAIFKYRDRTRWMAIIDVDEFMVPIEKSTVPEFLEEYGAHPAVVANWVCFDSNGYEKKPVEHGGLVTANYTRVRKNHNNDDRQVKSIINPKLVVYFVSPHHGMYYENSKAVTENLEVTQGIASRVHSTNKIQINHYRSKSKEEYINRLTKNSKNIVHPIGAYKFNEELLNFPDETTDDLKIQKYLPQLKRSLNIKD